MSNEPKNQRPSEATDTPWPFWGTCVDCPLDPKWSGGSKRPWECVNRDRYDHRIPLYGNSEGPRDLRPWREIVAAKDGPANHKPEPPGAGNGGADTAPHQGRKNAVDQGVTAGRDPHPVSAEAIPGKAIWHGQHEVYIAFESVSGLPCFVGLGRPHVEHQIQCEREKFTDPFHEYPYEYNITGPWKLEGRRERAIPTGRYYCASGRHFPEGHDPEECPPCLRAHRDGIRREYEANVSIDLVARLREMDRRIHEQRKELARLNERVARPPSPIRVEDACEAWLRPGLDRWAARAARVAFRDGWKAARRALSLDEGSPSSRTGENE